MELTIEQALQRGIAAHSEGKLSQAEELYQVVLRAQPHDPDANHNLGALAMASNRADLALSFFKTALEANPNIEQFWLSYIDAFIKDNQFDNAKQVIQKGRNQGVSLEKLSRLEMQIDTTIETKNSLQQHLDRLTASYQTGKYDDAEKQALAITQKFPKNQLGWKALGAIFLQTDRKQEAVDAQKRAVELSPGDPIARNNLGNTFKDIGRLIEAEASFRQALFFKPDFAEAQNNLGVTLKKLGRLDEADASYKRALEVAPDFAEAHNNRGNTLKDMGKLEEAEVSLRQALRLKPDFAEAHNNLGNILQSMGKIEEAEVSYRAAIGLKFDFAEAHYSLGNMLKKLGRLHESIESLKHAVESNPDHIDARMNLDAAFYAAVPPWHFAMMNDEPRNNAYFDAIKRAVDDGMLVLEIGTGSGLLSMMAAANGAEQVITCESSETISDAAREIINSNGFGQKITVVNKRSTDLIVGKDLPEKADVIISEVLSAEFVGEGVINTTLDANERLLKESGTIIPQAGKIRISLVGDSPEIRCATSVRTVQGFDLSKFNLISKNKFSLSLREKPALLSNSEDAFNINLYGLNDSVKEEKTIKLQVNQNGLCIGVIQWLWVRLYEDIEYENRPGEKNSHWPSIIYLFEKSIDVQAGDILQVRAVLGEDNVWFYQLI